MNLDEFYMQRCLQLALLGLGKVAPNPMVGSVLIHEGIIIGEGYHRQFGQSHAEVNCLDSVKPEHRSLISASTLYVSLEPCSHFGKTPPCADLIVKSGIKKVVIGCSDISSKVNGKGIAVLKENGVEVVEDILETDCIELNKRFFTAEKMQRPYIILKWAESADGFIGKTNQQIRISNMFTDRLVHQWRADEEAIMVGYQTALTDNPSLNVRLVQGKDPLRIVIDKFLTLPATHHFFDQKQPGLIFNFIENRSAPNTEWIKIDEANYLAQVLNTLYNKQIQSVIIEGGRALIQQFSDRGLWDEARVIKSENELHDGIQSPELRESTKLSEFIIHTDRISYYINKLRSL